MNPFAQLLDNTPMRLPKSTASSVVVAGKRVTDVRQIDRLLLDGDEPDEQTLEEIERLRKEAQRAKARARYQRSKLNPEAMAKRKQWYRDNREKVLAYKAVYEADPANKKRIREQKTAWARRNAAANREKLREAARRYYQRNREAILAKKKADKAARRAAAEVKP